MQEIVYLLRVPEDESLQSELCELWGGSPYLPNYVRVSTLAPLSNYGYPPGTEGCLLSLNKQGVVVGVPGENDVPRSFVPWSNISYIAESAELEHPVSESEATVDE